MTAEERRQQIIADINAVAAQLEHEHAQARRRPELPHIPRSRSALLWEVVLAIGLFGFPLILLGGYSLANMIWPGLWEDGPLSRRRALPAQEFVEALDVEGDCAEDHVKESAPYEGTITHTRLVTTGTPVVSGYVTLTPDAHHARMTRRPDPYGYEPSFSIGFTRLRPEDLQGDVLQLAGVSEYPGDEESHRPSHRVTCTLRVTRRLDQRPSRQDETAQ
jgi:hypothetical protein